MSSLARRSMAAALQKYSKFPIPANVPADLRELVSRSGSRASCARGRPAPLNTGDRPLLGRAHRQAGVRDCIGARISRTSSPSTTPIVACSNRP